jgi:hypothetical protein
VDDYGYRIIEGGGNTVLAVHTRSVSKARGLLLLCTSGLFGAFFLSIAVTSHHDRVLAGLIFLFAALCVGVSLYLMRKVVVHNIVFTPETMFVDNGFDSQTFDLPRIESFSNYRETLRVKYGTEELTVLRRVPHVGAIQAQVAMLVDRYKNLRRH